VKVSSDDLRRILRDEVLRHEIVVGDQADEAAQAVASANARMRAAQKKGKD